MIEIFQKTDSLTQENVEALVSQFRDRNYSLNEMIEAIDDELNSEADGHGSWNRVEDVEYSLIVQLVKMYY